VFDTQAAPSEAGSRWQSLAGGLDVANHRDGLEARRSQREYDRVSHMSGDGGDEDRF
jgi:hypothetical protein